MYLGVSYNGKWTNYYFPPFIQIIIFTTHLKITRNRCFIFWRRHLILRQFVVVLIFDVYHLKQLCDIICTNNSSMQNLRKQ